MTRRLLIIFVLAVGLVAVCALTWTITWRTGIDTLRRNAAVRGDRMTAALKSTLERYESLPYLISRHPLIQNVLVKQHPDLVDQANRYLEDVNHHARATATYIIREDGLCVAASNWRGPDSFIGVEYRFRPYFIDAIGGGVGRFFGIGTISHDPGYYISQPVRLDERIVGVMVESNLVAGRQDLQEGCALTYGQSITDACIGWDESVAVLEGLAESVKQRRVARGSGN